MSLKRRVQQRLEELKLSPAAASKKAGFAPTFVRDLIEGRKKNVRSDSLARLAKALQTTPEWLIKGESAPQNGAAHQLHFVNVRPILVRGSVQAGRWREATDEVFGADIDEIETVQIAPPPGYGKVELYGLRIVGNSMDLVYPEGTIVIVCPITETEVRDGDKVIVVRRKSGFAETTVKQANFTDNGWVLQARSSDPAFVEPIILTDEGDDTPEIIGVVIGSYRYETRPPAMYRKG